MANVNHAAREVRFKVAYYGPPFSGKRTNIEWIHSHLDAQSISPLAHANSAADKIVSFHFSLDGVSLIEDYATRVELCTIGGEVVFNAPRELILHDADGVVFVLDSRWGAMPDNVESLQNLHDNLARQNRALATVPHVFQPNKRDLPDAADLDYLKFVLDEHASAAPIFPATASKGENVFPALNAVLHPIVEGFARRHPRHSSRQPVNQLRSSLSDTPLASPSHLR